MALPTYDISFHAGETFELAITYKDSTGCALLLDLGHTAKIEGRLAASTGDPALWTVDTTDSVAHPGTVITLSNGSPNIHVNLTAAYTATLPVGTGVWDLKLTQDNSAGVADDIVTYVLGGSYTILDPVTT